jgi:hypothetical protein
MEIETSYGGKGCFLAVIMIIVGVFACSFSIYAAVDISCVNDAGQWMVDYPGAELIEEAYTGIRPFGIGYTERNLYTTDTLNDVRSWYVEKYRQLDLDGKVMNGGIGRMGFHYSAAADGGTNIRLSQECTSEMLFW